MADYDLTLGDLIGTIKTFFQRIGGWVLACAGTWLVYICWRGDIGRVG